VGLEASGNLFTLHGGLSLQGTLSLGGWNPFDWRLGVTFSIGGGVGAGLGASAGALISLSGAECPEAWGVGSLSQTAGISGGEELILGYDLSNIPRLDSGTVPIDTVKNLKHDFFVGGGLLTPWPLPIEFHYDTHVWTIGGSKSPTELWRQLGRGW